MMSLKMVEETLPAGFRFHPRDDELICDYLVKMVAGCAQAPHLIVVDLNKSEPWDIPQNACVGGKEYYFYSQRDRKYSTGLRTNRATVSGYWKATGKDRTILRKGTLVGMRKTLVFYEGRAPKGKKTDWVMHEFRLEGPLGPPKLSSSKEDWVLCRVFFKSSNDVVTKQELDYSGGEQASPSSTSLPPLMDTPYFDFSFDQNPNTDQHEQVPCFSIFATDQNPSHNHNYQPLSYLMNHQYSMQVPNFSTKNMPSYGGLPAEFGSNYLTTATSSSSSEQKVLKTVLNQLTKMESGGSPSFGEVSTTSESLLSEVDLSSMWNSQY